MFRVVFRTLPVLGPRRLIAWKLPTNVQRLAQGPRLLDWGLIPLKPRWRAAVPELTHAIIFYPDVTAQFILKLLNKNYPYQDSYYLLLWQALLFSFVPTIDLTALFYPWTLFAINSYIISHKAKSSSSSMSAASSLGISIKIGFLPHSILILHKISSWVDIKGWNYLHRSEAYPVKGPLCPDHD